MGTFGIEAGKAAINAGSGILGAAFGLATAGINDRRQIRQQDKLNEQAYDINNRMAEANYERQMRLWEDTNYQAQTEQMRKAGVNPGLLYGMSGGGGSTAAANAGTGVAAGQAPHGGGEIMGMMSQTLQMRMMEAQIKVMESQANKNNTDAAYTGGAQTDLTRTSIEGIKQTITSQQVQNELTKVQTNIAKLEEQYKSGTLENMIAQVANQTSIVAHEMKSARAKGDIDAATEETVIKAINQDYLNAIMQNKQMQQAITESAARVHKTNQEIETIIKTRYQSGEYLMLAQGGQNIEQNRIKMDQMYRQIAEETGMGEDVIKMIGGALMGGGMYNISKIKEEEPVRQVIEGFKPRQSY